MKALHKFAEYRFCPEYQLIIPPGGAGIYFPGRFLESELYVASNRADVKSQ